MEDRIGERRAWEPAECSGIKTRPHKKTSSPFPLGGAVLAPEKLARVRAFLCASHNSRGIDVSFLHRRSVARAWKTKPRDVASPKTSQKLSQWIKRERVDYYVILIFLILIDYENVFFSPWSTNFHPIWNNWVLRGEGRTNRGRMPLACRFLPSKEGNMNLEELLAVPFRFPWVTGSDRSFVLVSIYLLEIMLSNTYYYYKY